jgi:hypothetical protein
MAWSLVQKKSSTFSAASTSQNFTFSSNTTAGNRAIIALVYWDNGDNGTVTGVSDAKNGSWHKDFGAHIVDPGNSGAFLGIYVYSVQIATQLLTTDNITVTFSGATSGNNNSTLYSLREYSGLSTAANAVDKTASNSGTTTSASTGSTGTPAQSGELALTLYIDGDGNRTWSSAPSTTDSADAHMNNGQADAWIGDGSTGAGAYSNSGTLSGMSDGWQMAAVVYLLAGAVSSFPPAPAGLPDPGNQQTNPMLLW